MFLWTFRHFVVFVLLFFSQPRWYEVPPTVAGICASQLSLLLFQLYNSYHSHFDNIMTPTRTPQIHRSDHCVLHHLILLHVCHTEVPLLYQPSAGSCPFSVPTGCANANRKIGMPLKVCSSQGSCAMGSSSQWILRTVLVEERLKCWMSHDPLTCTISPEWPFYRFKPLIKRRHVTDP